jgi:hypothetical protein
VGTRLQIEKNAKNRGFLTFWAREGPELLHREMQLIFANGPIHPSTKVFEILA